MKSHPIDAVSLGAGLVFLGIAGFWLVARWVDLNVSALGWLAAGILVVLGGVGIVHTVSAARRRQ